MKRIITGLTVAGAGVAACVSAALAHAAGSGVSDTVGDWTYTYDFDGSELVQAPLRTQFAWAVPATFTDGDTTLTGIDYFRDATQGPNSEFVTDEGAIYAVDKQFNGFHTMYYAPDESNPPGSAGLIDSFLGKVPLASAVSWLVRPADYSQAIHYSDALDKVDISDVLNLGAGKGADDTWDPHLISDPTPIIGYQNLPMWSGQATFTPSDDGTPLSGTDYMWSPWGAVGSYNEEFVTDGGAVYAYSQGFLGLDNMYYDPGNGGDVVDILKTPLGNMDLSWLSWLFTPPDYSDAADATAESAVPQTELLEALDFGLAAQGAGSAADVAGAAADIFGGGL